MASGQEPARDGCPQSNIQQGTESCHQQCAATRPIPGPVFGETPARVTTRLQFRRDSDQACGTAMPGFLTRRTDRISVSCWKPRVVVICCRATDNRYNYFIFTGYSALFTFTVAHFQGRNSRNTESGATGCGFESSLPHWPAGLGLVT